MVAALVSMHGMTTRTRCASGIPFVRARRGRCFGCADSLISRLMTATTASEAGNAIKMTANSISPGDALSASLWCSIIQATRPVVPSASEPR